MHVCVYVNYIDQVIKSDYRLKTGNNFAYLNFCFSVIHIYSFCNKKPISFLEKDRKHVYGSPISNYNCCSSG